MNKEEAFFLIEQDFRTNHMRHVKRFNRYLNNMERAKDVVAEAYTRACAYWETIPEDTGMFPRWLNTVLNNSAKDNSKQELLRGAVDTKELENVEVRPTAIPAIIHKQVLERIERSQDEKLLFHKVDAKGAETQRVILRMFFIDGHKMRDIKEFTGRSISAIKKTVQRFRDEIKAQYRWSI